MKLEVHERILLLNLLPKEENYAGVVALRRAKEMLSFTPDEQVYYELKSVPGPDGKPTVSWNAQKATSQVKDVPVDEYTTNVIRNELAKLDKTKKLTDQHISVYEKFVVMYK